MATLNARIQIKSGNKANLPILSQSELALCKDSEEVFIGNNAKNLEICTVNKANNITENFVGQKHLLKTLDKTNIVNAINELTESESSNLYRQALVNGNFDVWQRGETFVNSNNFIADRWKLYRFQGASGIDGNMKVGQQDGSSKWLEVVRHSGDTSLNEVLLVQNLESQECLKFRGRQITISCKLNRTVNATGDFNLCIFMGKGIDENVSAGFTNGVGYKSNNLVVPTNTFEKFEYTVDIPWDISQFAIALTYNPKVTSLGNEKFEVMQFMVNEGKNSLQFMPKSYAQELENCQRYFEIIDGQYVGLCWTFAFLQVPVYLKTSKRVRPTFTFEKTNFFQTGSEKWLNIKTVNGTVSSNDDFWITILTDETLVVNQPYIVRSKIFIDAEL